MKRARLLLVLLPIALSACGSSGRVIPKTAGDSPLAQSYAQLRALGLRVRVQFVGAHTLNVSSLQQPNVDRVLPAPGTHMKLGGIVTILATSGMNGSPAVLKSNPRRRVPSFVGKRADAALRWASAHDMHWSIPHLPELPFSWASRLFAAYRVVAQQPNAGAVLGQGHLTGSGGYRLTPLVLTVRPG